MSDLVVVKYGGSILSDADSFRDVASYQIKRSPVALVSAPKGVTNRLIDIFDKRNPQKLSDLENMYRAILKPLPQKFSKQATEEMERETQLLFEYLNIGARDAFVGSGEEHSAILLSAHINALGGNAEHMSGPEAGFLLNDYGLIHNNSGELLKATVGKKLKEGKTVVVGGYLGRHYKTLQYKLGARNINDAFATTLTDVLNASAVEIIKDVPGVYRVPPEFGKYGLLKKLSYDEARKISWRGSPVVYPTAIKKTNDKNIPIVVKDMKSKGTIISSETQTTPEKFVAVLMPERTYIVTIRDDIMDTPEGRGYFAVISKFESENGIGIGVIASDVGGISYTITMGDRKRAEDASSFKTHNESLKAYLHSHGYNPVVEGEEVGVITVVGDAMQKRAGTLADLSSILGKNGISVRSASQSDEKYAPPSITFVVGSENLEASVKALSEELFLG